MNRFLATSAIALALVVPALFAGCQATEPGGPGSPTAPQTSVRDDLFELTIAAERPSYAVDEPIEVAATIRYLGDEAALTTWGSGSGVVLFSLEQVDGPRDMAAAATADCVPAEIPSDPPLRLPFAKSGGFSGDDPNAEFWRRFFADPVLRLPAGEWRITATFERFLDGCPGPEHRLNASITIEVR